MELSASPSSSSSAASEALIQTLISRGWCFGDVEQVKAIIVVQSALHGGSCTVDFVESELVNMDLRSLGGKSLPDASLLRKSSYLQGPKVLQLSSVRDISRSSTADTSPGSNNRRLLRFFLTDGHSQITAIEYSHIPSIADDVVPGTKVRLGNKAPVHSGIVCLNPKVITILGGVVPTLYEEWQMNKKYSGFDRSLTKASKEGDTGGPPPFEKLQIEAVSRQRPQGRSSRHTSSHSTLSTAPIGSPKPIGALPSKSATSSAAMSTFKDHASSKNSWQATPSKSLPSLTPQVQSTGEASFDDLMDPVELEGLIARIEKPPIQSIPLSSNEAAVHIQKGLFISLQSSTISIEDIITQSNGVISLLKSFTVDLSSLYEKVKTLVKYSVLWTKVSSTSDKDVFLGELEAQYEVKKTNFEEMASSYEEMASSVSKLSERVTSLEEEIVRTKELLKKLESELSSCKAKHSSSQSDLTKYSQTISKSEEDLHAALDVVDQCKKKSAHYDAVKEALDAARASLMN